MKFTSKFSFIPILMIFSLNIFIFLLNSCTTLDFIEEKISAVLDFPSKSSSSILYPQIFSNSFDSKIISPIKMPLKKGETYHFEINCPERKFLALIDRRNFTLDFESDLKIDLKFEASNE